MQQTRTIFGVLTTPQQQTIGKYMDNKTRPTFSFH
jgi:sorbitol-specific phosphotransferase system component IIC